MFLDMRTLIFTNVVSALVALIIVFSLWRQSRNRFSGLGYLAVDFALQTVAVLLISLRGRIPDGISMVLANSLVIAGAILGLMGLERFLNKKSFPAPNILILGAFIVVHSYFSLVHPSLAFRNLNLSVGMVLIFLQCVWLLLYRVDPGLRPLTRGIGLVFAAFSLVNGIRIIEFFIGTHRETNFLEAPLFDRWVLVFYQILWLLLTYSLVLMVNKRLLQEVRVQEEKFTKAFHSAPYALTLTRLPQGEILEVNAGFRQMTGYRPEEVVGRTTPDLRLWVREADRDTAVSTLAREGRIRGAEYVFRKKSGETLTGLFSAETLRINDQPVVLSSISDITGRKQAEAEREKLIEELQATLVQVKQLSGLLPICASCKKIRDDRGYWTQIETYIRNHSEADFSHGICPECEQRLYPEYYDRADPVPKTSSRDEGNY